MIHFDVQEVDEDRTLHIEGTRIYVGEIVRGRRMTDLCNHWTEWAFIDANGVQGEVHRSIDPAFADARAFAATLPGANPGPTTTEAQP